MSFTIKLDKSKDLKSVRKQFQETGVFYTDPKLAEMVKGFLPADTDEAYDPTAGCGNLLSVFGDDVAKFGQELDPAQAEACNRLPNCQCVAGNTLTEPAFMDRKFRAIVANFPFSVRWDPKRAEEDPRFFALGVPLPPASKADYAFILHILHMLSEDGTAVVIVPHGILFRGNAEGKIRKYILEQNWIDSITGFEKGYFQDTSIPVAVLVFRKHRDKDTIRFADHERDLERDVSLAEIRENDFNLNIPRYLQPPMPEEPYIDPAAVWKDFVKTCQDSLRTSLECARMMADMQTDTGADFGNLDDFRRAMTEVLNEAC